MKSASLYRLLSARHLLENSGPFLSRHSGSRAIAQAILLSHDAAELVLSTISEELSTGLGERASFPELAGAVQKAVGESFRGAEYLKRLNTVRVSFKHHGILPESGTWFDAKEQTSDLLDQLCEIVFSCRLTTLDIEHLVEDERARQLIQEAKKRIIDEDFKGALETLAKALYRAGIHFPAGLSIEPGNADTETALLLTGYGVEPSTFISMQQCLPEVINKEIKWSLREYGHPGNWNYEIATFCLEAVTDVILHLQHARSRPRPLKFHDVYRDVITIQVDSPYVRQGSFFSPGFSWAVSSDVFTKGDTIYGNALSSYDDRGEITLPIAESESVEFIKLENPTTKKLEATAFDFLILRRGEVTISYEENPSAFRGAVEAMSEEDRQHIREALFDI